MAEILNKTIENLKPHWPTLRIIHGKPKYSQSGKCFRGEQGH